MEKRKKCVKALVSLKESYAIRIFTCTPVDGVLMLSTWMDGIHREPEAEEYTGVCV